MNNSWGCPTIEGCAPDTLRAIVESSQASGIFVEASAGNSGPAPYITGSPASGRGVVSVAAVDSTARFPAAVMTLAGGSSITAIDANGAPLSGGTLPVFVLRTATGTVSLGCGEAEYVDASIAGKLVVTRRGTCARVDRAIFGQKHGAAAVAMINNGPGYPPFEGDIPGVAIPFLGVLTSDASKLTGSTTAARCERHARQPRLPGGRGLQFRRPALRRQSFEAQRGRAGRVDPLHVLRKRQSGRASVGNVDGLAPRRRGGGARAPG